MARNVEIYRESVRRQADYGSPKHFSCKKHTSRVSVASEMFLHAKEEIRITTNEEDVEEDLYRDRRVQRSAYHFLRDTPWARIRILICTENPERVCHHPLALFLHCHLNKTQGYVYFKYIPKTPDRYYEFPSLLMDSKGIMITPIACFNAPKRVARFVRYFDEKWETAY